MNLAVGRGKGQGAERSDTRTLEAEGSPKPSGKVGT